MQTNLHLVFAGQCSEAFAFYEKTFNGKIQMCMKYGDAPGEMPIPADAKDLVMHMSMPLGSMLLMGCDAPPERRDPNGKVPMGGFHISISLTDEAEVKRIYTALTEGGTLQMPLMPTFWSPQFGMCTDKFGVEWMVSVPGPQM
jgi:PhnB protein